VAEVYNSGDDIVVVGDDWLRQLKEAAAATPLRRARLCLHRSVTDPIQEMVIALIADALFPPHRHPDKTESYHVVEGELYVLIFDDDGRPRRAIFMTRPGGGGAFCYRLSIPAWHAVVPASDCVVLHEVTTGPFLPGQRNVAPWAPTEAEALRRFLRKSLDEALHRHAVDPC